MAIKSVKVSVGTAATKLTVVETDTNAGYGISVKAGTQTLYVGGPDVTTVNGWDIAAGSSLSLDIDWNEDLYAVVATGTDNVTVLRAGV